jgi:glycosyltransferase involved in cell wall biosynthesis
VPNVSVIIATYNRSNVLTYALRSLLRSSYADWEALVIGDACTDDTAAVVASLGDPRISFTNLPRNIGEQSGPNNEGFRRASGRYIAYLNHDDLWFPDHLELAVAALERTGADLVYALAAMFGADGTRVLGNISPNGRYPADLFVPASCWVLRRELLESLGGWRSARDCYVFPSLDFLQRARAAGKDMRLLPKLTVVHISSVVVPGAYARRAVGPQAQHFHRLTTDPHYREDLLADLALDELTMHRWFGVRYHARRILEIGSRRLALRLGISPAVAVQLINGRRRGTLIDDLRRARGLPDLKYRKGAQR